MKNDTVSTVKAIIALLIVILAFGIYFLFNANKDALEQAGSLQQYLLLIVLAMGLLVGLFYLVSQKTVIHSAPSRVSKSTKKKKKTSR